MCSQWTYNTYFNGAQVDIVVQWAAIKTIKVRFFIVSSVLDFHDNLKETTCNSQPPSGIAKPVGKP